MIYLQISTAQGPAECRIFARFVLGRLLAEAQAEGVEVEIISETADKHGIMSAVLKLDGKPAETLAQRWQGSLQWICASPVRPKPAVRAAKAGSTSIKLKVLCVLLIKQAVFPCALRANAVNMPTKNWL